jgi:hypothetical protein
MKISGEMALSDALPVLSLGCRAVTWISLPRATFFFAQPGMPAQRRGLDGALS